MIAVLAAAVLVGVLWSLVRAMRTEGANAVLRRDGVQATGTVVDNTMTSTPQRRLLFSPVVEFRAQDGRLISDVAHQSAATSWPLRPIGASAPAHSSKPKPKSADRT